MSKLLKAINSNCAIPSHRAYFLQKNGFEVPGNLQPSEPDQKHLARIERLINNALRRNVKLWNQKPYSLIEKTNSIGEKYCVVKWGGVK